MYSDSIDQLHAVSVAETLASEKGIVDLWYYFYEGTDTELLASHEGLLTPSMRRPVSVKAVLSFFLCSSRAASVAILPSAVCDERFFARCKVGVPNSVGAAT